MATLEREPPFILSNQTRLFRPIHLSHANIALVATLSHFFASVEQAFSFCRELLHDGCETNFTLQEVSDTSTHLLVSQSHTETKFAEVFEQGVSPCRTLTLFIFSTSRMEFHYTQSKKNKKFNGNKMKK